MFAFRESYEDVAFLYVSDDMDWARKNLKDKHHDLVRKFYFVHVHIGNLLNENKCFAAVNSTGIFVWKCAAGFKFLFYSH
jgi:hypothetical protein